MQRINEDIKNGNFRQMYLLYGEEAYLRKQYRDRLKKAMISDDDTMNYSYLEGKDISIGAVIDLAETLPFFADRRVIVVENSGLFKHGGEQLAQYLSSPAETAYFVFVETEIDKRSKLFKTVSSQGTAVEFPVQSEATLKKWILGMIKREGKTDHRAGSSLFYGKNRYGYGKYSKRAGKAHVLLHGEGGGKGRGYRRDLHEAYQQPYLRYDQCHCG